MPDTLLGMTVRPPESLIDYVNTTLTRHGFDVEQPIENKVTSYDGMFCGVEFTQTGKTIVVIINFAPSVLEFWQGEAWVSFGDLT